jgi:hypothetical protein
MVTKLFRNGDEIYVVLREFSYNYLMSQDGSIKTELFNAWKGYLGADKVFKNPTHFVFCEKIPDIEYEEIN